MFARATMNFGTLNHVVARIRRLLNNLDQATATSIVQNGKVSYQKVELGRRMGNKYEIVSGVENGDHVVITGQEPFD